MATFQIERGVPIPEASGGRHAKYPWADMLPGDSFYVPLNGRDSVRAQQSISGAGRAKFGKGNIRSAKEGDGIRVWRLA